MVGVIAFWYWWHFLAFMIGGRRCEECGRRCSIYGVRKDDGEWRSRCDGKLYRCNVWVAGMDDKLWKDGSDR